MKKIAVTGGAGFIGSNLLERLISQGHEVTVVDDLSTGLKSNLDLNKITFHELSLTDRDGLAKAVNGVDAIVHLGARGSVPRSIKNPVATHDVNVTGTLNVLEAARINSAQVIFSSSSSVYGRNGQLPKDETMWLSPLTPYAASKLAGEGYVQAYGAAYDVPVTLLRFFNVFGPRQRPDHEYAAVLPKWIWKAMNNEAIDVYGDGSQTRDFTYVLTVLDVIEDALNRGVRTEGAVNLAYGNRISLLETIELLKFHFPDLKVNFQGDRLGDVKNSQNHPILLKQLFPSVKPTDFSTALSETVNWLKEFGQSVANGPATVD
jgi:UDP-glucose 4-epimerase